MRFEKAVTVHAPAEIVWGVMVDLESWPEMTRSMTSVERVDDGPLRVGSRVRISQPRLPDALWIITEWVEGQRFVWETNGFGLWTAATHSLLELPEETTLHLEIEQAGLLSVPVGLAFGPLTNRYLDWESQGFKKRAEAVG